MLSLHFKTLHDNWITCCNTYNQDEFSREIGYYDDKKIKSINFTIVLTCLNHKKRLYYYLSKIDFLHTKLKQFGIASRHFLKLTGSAYNVSKTLCFSTSGHPLCFQCHPWNHRFSVFYPHLFPFLLLNHQPFRL